MSDTIVMKHNDKDKPWSRRAARNMRDLRRDRGLTQRELASAIGVHRSSIESIETRHTTPALSTLVKLHDRYGVSIDTMLFGDVCEVGSP